MSMLNHLFVYICGLNPRLMLIEIIEPMVSGHHLGWLTSGKLLNPYQKRILHESGLSTRKWTSLLYEDDSPIFTDLLKVCEIVGINIEDVAVHYK